MGQSASSTLPRLIWGITLQRFSQLRAPNSPIATLKFEFPSPSNPAWSCFQNLTNSLKSVQQLSPNIPKQNSYHVKFILVSQLKALIPSIIPFLPVQCQQLRDHLQLLVLHFSFFSKPLLVLFVLFFVMVVLAVRIWRCLTATSRAHLLI